MKMTNQFHYIYILLLTLIYLSRIEAVVQTALRLMTPIINTRFYVLCDVQISSSDEDEIFFNHPVQIKDSNLQCKIYDWRFCNMPIPAQKNGACGCSSKKNLFADSLMFTFYLLIDPVSEIYLGSQVTCEVFTAKDTRQIELVTFTRKPEEILYACKNSSVRFDWEFKPIRESISSRFMLRRIAWRALSPTGSRKFLGTYWNTNPKEPMFSNDGNIRSKLTTENTKLPQLILTNVHLSDTKQDIKINVSFQISDSTDSRPKRVEGSETHIQDHSTPAAGHSNDAMMSTIEQEITDETSIYVDITSTNDDHTYNFTDPADTTDTTATSTTTTTTATTTTTTTTTTTPRPTTTTTQTTTPWSTEMIIDPPVMHMIDSVYLIVADPPSSETKVTIKAYGSITGNLVVTCQVFMVHPGDPPVNMSIWQDDRRLITRGGVTIMHYSTQTEGKTISCGLEGRALDCLHDSDNRRKRVVFNLKDLETANKPDKTVDLLLSMYAWESLSCIIMIFWTISLLLDHIRYEIRRARKELERSNRDVLLAEKKRLEKLSLSTELALSDANYDYTSV